MLRPIPYACLPGLRQSGEPPVDIRWFLKFRSHSDQIPQNTRLLPGVGRQTVWGKGAVEIVPSSMTL